MKLIDILKESEASEKAKKMGLVSGGWGRWNDKQGNTVATTVDGKLHFLNKVEPASKDNQDNDDDVRTFANTAHGDQKYGKDKPYSYHLDKVYDNAVKFGGSRTAQIAARLHDVLEDTSVPYETIEEKFGKDVADVVQLVSNLPDKAETYRRIRTNPDAVFVKLCDRLANVSEGQKNDKYRKEQPLFKSILYRPGEFDELWNAIEERLKS